MAAAGHPGAAAARAAADAGAGVGADRARRRRRRDGDGVAQPAGRQRLQGVPRRRRPDRAARTTPASPPRIALVDPTTVPLAAEDDPLIERLDASIVDRYVAVDARRCGCARRRPASRVAYTPMHGVGGEIAVRAFAGGRAAGAARRRGAVRARPGVPDRVVPEPGGAGRDGPGDRRWRAQHGAAAGDRQRSRRRPARRGDPAARRLVAAARRRRDRVAARRPHPRATPTGRRPPRRHDARVVVAAVDDGGRLRRALRRDVHRVQVDRPRAVLDRPELRFVFGYEQALGYLVAPRPLDKDGITAAVLLAEVAAVGGRGGHDAAGPPRRHRRPLRPPRHRRPVDADGPGGGRRAGARAAGRPARPSSPAPRSST